MSDNIYAGICPACESDNIIYSDYRCEFLSENLFKILVVCLDCKTDFNEFYKADFIKAEITGKKEEKGDF